LNRYFVRDVIVNIALYVPVGMSAYFVFRSRRSVLPGLIAPVLFGGVLSSSIEMLQLFVPLRICSAMDVVTNVIGSTLGVIAALLFQELAGEEASRAKRAGLLGSLGSLFVRTVDRSALALLFCAAAYLVAPFFPIMGHTLLEEKLTVFFHSPIFSPVPFLSAAGFWFVSGLLLQAANLEPARLWLGVGLLAIPCQLTIMSRQPAPSDLLGAGAGFLLFATIGRVPRIIPVMSGVFLVLLIMRGLAPFHFQPEPNTFTWTPFGGFLNMDWQSGLIVILEKMFYYGAAIWLLRAAGVPLAMGTSIVAAILAFVEVAQIWLPGRTSETTDPLIAILIGLGMKAARAPVQMPHAADRVALRNANSC
jgi:VanZ family protein